MKEEDFIEIPYCPKKHKVKTGDKVVVFNWFNKKPPFESGSEFVPASQSKSIGSGKPAVLSKSGDVSIYNIGTYRVRRITDNSIYVF